MKHVIIVDEGEGPRPLEERIQELEAELAQCLDCCKRVGKLESERDKYKELAEYTYSRNGHKESQIVDKATVYWWISRHTELEAELKQTNDMLQEAVQSYGDMEAERDAALLQLSECQDSYRAMCEQVDAAKAQNMVLRDASQRLSVLAVKWVDAGHHDWPEIKNLLKIVDG